MNTLFLEPRAYLYEIDGVERGPHKQTEFIVDGESLAEKFGFERNRPWFGQTRLEVLAQYVEGVVSQLIGEVPPQNQFGTPRFVLYGCHCGCDLCGCKNEKKD